MDRETVIHALSSPITVQTICLALLLPKTSDTALNQTMINNIENKQYNFGLTQLLVLSRLIF